MQPAKWNIDRVKTALAAAAYVGVVFDAMATYLGVHVFRVAHELNPVVLSLVDALGFELAMAARVLIGCALIFGFTFLISKLDDHPREKKLSVYGLGLASGFLVALALWHVLLLLVRLAS